MSDSALAALARRESLRVITSSTTVPWSEIMFVQLGGRRRRIICIHLVNLLSNFSSVAVLGNKEFSSDGLTG